MIESAVSSWKVPAPPTPKDILRSLLSVTGLDILVATEAKANATLSDQKA
jgi:hypothetical protein